MVKRGTGKYSEEFGRHVNYLDIVWSTVSHTSDQGGADVGKHYIVLSLPNEGWGPVTFFSRNVWRCLDLRGQPGIGGVVCLGHICTKESGLCI